MHAIETHQLTRRFGRVGAVKDLNLRVPAGSVFALLGPNGAGKTTTIKLLMRLLEPTAGEARVLAVDARRLGVTEWQRIGYVSENQRLPDWMSTAELLAYCRPFYPSWDDDFARRLQQALELDPRAPLRTLSRGGRMKAALLSSLAYRPELILLDEPFSGLDPLVREELVRALLEAPGDRPWTVLVSSHDVDEVERLADWVAFMVDGRLVLAEPVESLLTRYRVVEVIGAEGEIPDPLPNPAWIPVGSGGRTLRFIDTRHDAAGAEASIAAAFPAATVEITAMPLREIFITLARRPAPAEAL